MRRLRRRDDRGSGERGSGERGETLVEVMVSVVVLGVAVVALVGGLASAILMSGIHRKQAKAGAYVRAYAEAIEAAVNASPTGYVACAAPAVYAALYDPGDAAFDRSVERVEYWNGTAFVATCAPDSGVQRVGLEVHSADGKVSEKLSVIIRKPCRAGDAVCT